MILSVLSRLRNESSVDYLHTARQLQIRTIKEAVKFPKRYTFYISQPLVSCSVRLYDDVVKANSIYPGNPDDARLRRGYLIKARAEAYTLTSQMELAFELFGMDYSAMQEWAGLVADEIRLINGVLKSDRNRIRE